MCPYFLKETVVVSDLTGEFDLIQRMTRSVRSFSDDLLTGIGDDCAVVSGGEKNDLLLTADMLVEKVHFDRRWFSPEQIGGKALRVSLSDIAAMGGVPEFALVSFAVPATLDSKEVEAIYRGILETAAAFEVTIAGGDLSRTAGEIVLDIILIGKVEKGRAILRSGAKPGDRIFVSGRLGDAALGLLVLKSGQTAPDTGSLIQRQLIPEPLIELGQALGRGRWASAMIDVSDGLSSDLGHICKASDVGARVKMKDLPVSEASARVRDRLSIETESVLLHGGEDYELLFTVPSELMTRFQQETFPAPLAEIGVILPASEGLVLELSNDVCKDLKAGGFDHFRHSL
jgi:thiamine-monophosphate kinase